MEAAVLRGSERKGKIGHELSRWRKKAIEKGFKVGNSQKAMWLQPKEEGAGRVLCDEFGEVARPDPAKPFSPRQGFAYCITEGF